MSSFVFTSLHNVGYPARQASATFSQIESYAGVRFALAARISTFRADYYGVFAGNQTKASLSVNWEVFDASTRRVVYQTVTSGASMAAGRSAEAVGLAFRTALADLLANEDFVSALAPRTTMPHTTVAARPTLTANWRRSLPKESDIISIGPGDLYFEGKTPLERASDAVVALHGSEGLGSAFLITRDGLAITNFHVINGQSQLVARTGKGVDYAVRVIRSDSVTDLALVEIACARDCFTSTLRQVPQPTVGTEVFAIGTPLSESLSQSVSKGIVSGVRRNGTVSVLQTDAAVNHGNSGGPLVDSSGSVVGIVTSKLVATDVEGVGFAISVQDALRVLGVAVR
jgi:S1-C subfamily serine protease